MPCRDEEADEARWEDLYARLQAATKAACDALTKLEGLTRSIYTNLPARDAYDTLQPATIRWWREHKQADMERKAREARAKQEQRKRDEEAFELLRRKLGK